MHWGVGKTYIPFMDSLDQVFLSTPRCNSKIYFRIIMGHQYLCLNIPEIGSLQKETMKSLTVPLEGFCSSLLWH